MDEEAALLQQVVTALERIDVPYMIGGGVALGVWAAPRMTHDLDIVVDLPLVRVPEFCAEFAGVAFALAVWGTLSPSLRQPVVP